jgi:DNA-binding response OmpR family regulator
MQAGKTKINCQPVAPWVMIDEVSAVIAPLIAHKRQQLTLQVDSDLPAVSADTFRLKQILINLLGNAHKFSPEASRITLAARRDDGFVCFSVIDQGNGIRPEDHDHVFQEFVQIGDGLTRAQDGTGLGLPITRRLVELHGGRIWIESAGAPGQGAAFHFTIPLAETPDAPTPPDLATDQRRRVLIIEDDRQFGNLLALYLSQQDYQPVHRYDGQAIVAAVRELRPALITLDLMLPGRDGWSVLQDLKSEPDTRDIPVIIISALDAAEAGLGEGAMEYLTKPLDADALLAALQRIDPAPHPPPHQVLIVDDDPLISELLTAMLPSAEYTVATATNGLDALGAIRRDPPDVILLDLLMPGLSGYELLELLRADSATHDLPVIVLTAMPLSDTEQAHLDVVAQTVIRKTELTRQHLVDALRRLRLPARPEPEMAGGPA